MSTPFLSIVLPAYNEEDNLIPLLQEITDAIATFPSKFSNYEVVIVDDGSNDNTWEVISKLSDSEPNVTGVKLRKNEGKATAFLAGFHIAKGDVIVTMDSDLQDDPLEIQKVVDKLDVADMVSGWKFEGKGDRAFASRFFNIITKKMTGLKLNDFNCPFKAYKRKVAKSLNLYGELHRFIPVIAAANGYKIVEVPVKNRPRLSGTSKYGIERFARGFLDLLTVTMLTNYHTRPLHLFGGVGIVLMLLGFACDSFPVLEWLVTSRQQVGHFALIILGVLFILTGIQFIFAGLIAELLISKNPVEPNAFISETTK